jgi:citrate synthase
VGVTGRPQVGLRSYDPGYMNTASATSRITYINGDKGILEHRGYPIEQLARAARATAAHAAGSAAHPTHTQAEKSTFLEVSYLLIYGALPDAVSWLARRGRWAQRVLIVSLPAQAQLQYFSSRVMRHTFIHEDLKVMMRSFR